MLISKFLNCNVEEKVINLERRYEITLPAQYLRKMWQAEIDKYGSMVQEEVLVD